MSPEILKVAILVAELVTVNDAKVTQPLGAETVVAALMAELLYQTS